MFGVDKSSVILHRVLRVVLTPKISRVNQISIFISGWVVGITPYAQFCPIPSPLQLIFSKNGFEQGCLLGCLALTCPVAVDIF